MIEIGTSLLTIIVLLVSMVTQPTRAQCPRGFVVANVRTSSQFEPRGTFTCDRPALGGDTDVLTGKSTAIVQPGEIKGRLYCTGGSSPIIVDSRIVGCSR